MRWGIDFIAWSLWAAERVYARKWSFLGVFAIVSLGGAFILGRLDLLPHLVIAETGAEATLASPIVSFTAHTAAESIITTELPTKIEIPAITIVANIANPITTDSKTLDQELLAGAVRYPTSALLGETGNMVLFGHSSYLPVVGNQAYKTFNGVQKLAIGDVIRVYSATTLYTYRVRSVTKENAKSDEGIPLEVSGRMLTLVTCNSFGTKEDRFVIVADLVEEGNGSIQ